MPRLLHGAFVVGAAGGTGASLARDFVKGGWVAAGVLHVECRKFRSAGRGRVLRGRADHSDLLRLERFYGTGTGRLGLDAGFTIGPLGEGGTTALDIVSFTWSRECSAGMSLAGMAITAAGGDNEAYYGQRVKPEEISPNGTLQTRQPIGYARQSAAWCVRLGEYRFHPLCAPLRCRTVVTCTRMTHGVRRQDDVAAGPGFGLLVCMTLYSVLSLAGCSSHDPPQPAIQVPLSDIQAVAGEWGRIRSNHTGQEAQSLTFFDHPTRTAPTPSSPRMQQQSVLAPES